MNYVNDFTALELLAAQYFNGRPCKLIPYIMGVTMSSSIAAGATGVGYQRVPANMAGLLVVAITAGCDSSVSFEDVNLQVTDTGSQERYFNSPVPFRAVASAMNYATARLNLPVPRLIAGNTQVEVSFENVGLASYEGTEVAFHGVAVYLMG